jgi:hypothetical protein
VTYRTILDTDSAAWMEGETFVRGARQCRIPEDMSAVQENAARHNLSLADPPLDARPHLP